MTTIRTPGVTRLIEDVDDAVRRRDPVDITDEIRRSLSRLIRSKSLQLPDAFHRTRRDDYARRLLHRDPTGRYTIVVMTWAPGQGTPVHDHAGTWCVEAVAAGEMEVIQYQLIESSGDRFRLRETGCIQAGLGSSGSLIPPFEYHVLRSVCDSRVSVTVHVYGGEMDRCCAFERLEDDWYRRVERSLPYHEA